MGVVRASAVKRNETIRLTLGVPLKQEVELDQCVAMQMNDPTNTVGVQRGVWVVGMVEDACVEVREHRTHVWL